MSSTGTRCESPLVFATTPNAESEEWVAAWKQVLAKGAWRVALLASRNADARRSDIIDSPVEAVDAEVSVEEACEVRVMVCLSCKLRLARYKGTMA